MRKAPKYNDGKADKSQERRHIKTKARNLSPNRSW